MFSEAKFIQDAYEQLAAAGESSLCCSPLSLYTREQLATLPSEVLKLSSGCGHPVNDAHILPGMTLIDIGSGAGADCMLAEQIVGPEGKIVGVDPSSSMREVAYYYSQQAGLSWIDYVEGTSDAIPVSSDVADVVISNCVLSLSTAAEKTWKEIARVLKPGAHAVVSDIVGGYAGDDPLGAKTRCETGISWKDYQKILHDSGFAGISVLRVKDVSFRDESIACSVSFDAKLSTGNASPRHRTVDIFYDPNDQHRARTIADALSYRVNISDATMSLRLLDSGDPSNRDLCRFISGDSSRGISISVDGRCLEDSVALADPDDLFYCIFYAD